MTDHSSLVRVISHFRDSWIVKKSNSYASIRGFKPQDILFQWLNNCILPCLGFGPHPPLFFYPHWHPTALATLLSGASRETERLCLTGSTKEHRISQSCFLFSTKSSTFIKSVKSLRRHINKLMSIIKENDTKLSVFFSHFTFFRRKTIPGYQLLDDCCYMQDTWR